jgi:membrane-bound lytic murein transglycosylase D
MRLVSLVLATFFSLIVTPARADTFPRPASLEPQIRFWRSVFADYSRLQVVVHDTVDLDKVYSVLDFRASADLGPITLDNYMRDATAYEVARIREILLRLDEAGPKPTGLTADEQRIFDLFKGDTRADRFRAATEPKRLRTQRGLREKFAKASGSPTATCPRWSASSARRASRSS